MTKCLTDAAAEVAAVDCRAEDCKVTGGIFTNGSCTLFLFAQCSPLSMLLLSVLGISIAMTAQIVGKYFERRL